jgi:hypothetical protein
MVTAADADTSEPLVSMYRRSAPIELFPNGVQVEQYAIEGTVIVVPVRAPEFELLI